MKLGFLRHPDPSIELGCSGFVFGERCLVTYRRHAVGKTMATIPMIPGGPVTTLSRSILITERRMSGTGGDDFLCGHCGTVMLEDFRPVHNQGQSGLSVRLIMKTIMTYNSQQVTVATDRRGDSGRRCREARAKSQSLQLHLRDDSRTAAAGTVAITDEGVCGSSLILFCQGRAGEGDGELNPDTGQADSNLPVCN